MEEVVFEAEKCHVFRVPPSDVYTSARWEGNHIWSGTIRCILHSLGPEDLNPKLSIRLIDGDTGAPVRAMPGGRRT